MKATQVGVHHCSLHPERSCGLPRNIMDGIDAVIAKDRDGSVPLFWIR